MSFRAVIIIINNIKSISSSSSSSSSLYLVKKNRMKIGKCNNHHHHYHHHHHHQFIYHHHLHCIWWKRNRVNMIIYNAGKRRIIERRGTTSTISRAREAVQQLAASYYGFDPESMRVFFFGPFSEAQLTGSFSEVLFGSAFFLGSGPFSALSATSISSTS